MTDQKLTIEDLFSDKGEYDEDVLVEVLFPHITIQKNTNNIFFKGTKLSVDKKILAYALAKKLLKSKGLIDSEIITAQEIHEKTGIKKGTIDPNFKKLREEGSLMGKGEYEVPAYKIQEVLTILSENDHEK